MSGDATTIESFEEINYNDKPKLISSDDTLTPDNLYDEIIRRLDDIAGTGAAGTGAAAKASTPNTNLDAAIAKARPKPKKTESPAHPDEAGSRTQSSKAKGKSSYCYIGEDRGFRSCIKVDDPGTCLSGEIFPTRDICINPTLRE